jgi:hypothetical protein
MLTAAAEDGAPRTLSPNVETGRRASAPKTAGYTSRPIGDTARTESESVGPTSDAMRAVSDAGPPPDAACT